MEIRLKKADSSEAEKIRIFAEWTFRATFEHLNSPEPFQEYCRNAFDPAYFLSLFFDPSAEFWAAFSPENELLAYLKVNFDKPNDAENSNRILVGKQTELERIYVHPEKKGLGLGRILIEKAIELAKNDGSKWIWLGVWERNPAAISVYEKMGFEHLGDHIFRIGDDAQTDFIMVKSV